MHYKKKPIIIEAIKWTGHADSTIRVSNFVGQELELTGSVWTNDAVLIIPTLEGNMNASMGDYIIKGIKGEFYPCKPDVFVETYEPVDA